MAKKSVASQRYLLINAGRLIDGRAKTAIPNGAVLIQGSKVVAAGRASAVRAPDGAAVDTIEYPGMTVMPGMVDCHTHHNGFGDGRPGDFVADVPDEVLALQSARNARASLFTGVTTIRENGPKAYTMLRLRESVNAGLAVGPRMVLCGWPVSIIGGHMWYFGGQTTGPTEVRAMVRRLVKEGADYIKVTATGGTTKTSYPLLPSFNVDELKAVADTAHGLGKLTAAHCTATQGIVNALDGGIDMIIHCTFRDADGKDRFREDIAERIGKQGTYVNPTLQVLRSTVWALERKKQERALTPNEQARLDFFQRNFDRRMEDCRRLVGMGLKVITGSDSSWTDYQLGNTVYEVECLTDVGFSPMRAVQSVTADAAVALGVDRIVGTLEPGKEADVIVVDGDPSRDVRALWNVREVFLAGKRVERGSDASIAATRQHPPSES
ncbi:MAG: amidohydrolase family protein [SAR202 cluster bacterium]|nr:amidohydrolase family protein [SAR202 cluster bacterium]